MSKHLFVDQMYILNNIIILYDPLLNLSLLSI